MYILAIATALSASMPAPMAAAAQAAPAAHAGSVARTALTFSALHGSTAALQGMDAFAMPAGAAYPAHAFRGTLSLDPRQANKGFAEVGTSRQQHYRDPGTLPAFSFQFVQHGGHLVPVQRGLIPTAHPDWGYILEPGRVWQEAGDRGYSRASLPFSLQEKGANCTHNGVMSFVFQGKPARISRVAYQIASETCQYFQFNAWGLANARYTPHPVSGAALLAQRYDAEVAGRLPVKPIAELARDFPHARLDVGNIGGDQSAPFRTVFGVAVNGVNYVGGCQTRAGAYPFCEVLDLPSYSLAKSIVGGIGLMRLEKRFPGVQNAHAIGSTLPQCGGKRWRDVTLLHALDMSTGNYDSPEHTVDENAPLTEERFFTVATYEGKLDHACAYGRKAAPGTEWVYHTSDTFLLGAAMNAVLQSHEGPARDLYRDVLVQELWKPLQLSPTSHTTARTSGGKHMPFSGYGLTLHHDDLVKLGQFLLLNRGAIVHGGPPMLDARLLDEAMQRTPRHGLATGRPGSRYQHGFWAWDAATIPAPGPAAGVPLCARPTWIPYMSGFGGIGVVLLPNDMVYYFVSDNAEYGFKRTLAELHQIRPLC